MLKIYFQFELYNSECELLRRTRRRKSRSFVQGFLKLVYVWFQQNNTISTTDTGGTSRTVQIGNTLLSHHFVATGVGRGGRNSVSTNVEVFGSSPTVAMTSARVGIVLGTGTTAVSPTDFQLATQVEDGITASTIEHFSSSGTGLTVSNPTGSFTLERLYRNSSGGTITVNEIGLYVIGSTNSIPFSFCIIRDLVSPGFAIANAEYARVIYTITVTV